MRHKLHDIILIFLIATVPAIYANWIGPEQVSQGGSGRYSQFPSMAVDSAGQVFVAWAEKSTSDGYGMYYRVRNTSGTWSSIHALHNDDGIVRWSDSFEAGAHIAVDQTTDKASAVFFQRSEDFYLGVEGAAVFCNYGLEYTGITMDHLHPISGMADHLKDPFIVFNPYVYDNFFVFWSQHEFSDHADHDIYYNYLRTETVGEDEMTGWQFVKKASDSPKWDFEFFPHVAVNNSEDSGTPTEYAGDMYLVTTDWDNDSLFFTLYDASADDWGGTDEILILGSGNTINSYGASVAYYYEGVGTYPHHIVVAYYYKDIEHHIYHLRVLESVNEGGYWNERTTGNVSVSGNVGKFGQRPAIGIDGNGVYYFAFIDFEGDVALISYDGSNWSNVIKVVHNCKTHRYVDLHLESDGDYNIIYDEYEATDDRRIYWIRNE